MIGVDFWILIDLWFVPTAILNVDQRTAIGGRREAWLTSEGELARIKDWVDWRHIQALKEEVIQWLRATSMLHDVLVQVLHWRKICLLNMWMPLSLYRTRNKRLPWYHWLLLFNKDLEGSVEGKGDSSIDYRWVVPLLNLGIQKFTCELFELTFFTCTERIVSWCGVTACWRRWTATITAQRHRRRVCRCWVWLFFSLKERYLADVTNLAVILIVIELQVLKIIFQRMSHNYFVVQNFL